VTSGPGAWWFPAPGFLTVWAGSLAGVRVVSLLPSATEIVYALGLGDQLVGVTFECDEPACARQDKAVVVGGRDTSAMSPAAIDAYVRAQLAAGRDLYTLHAGALAALAPELILTQDLCRVCALPAGHVEDALDYLGCTAEVISLDPHSLDDVLATILTVGEHAGAQRQARHLVAALRQRLAVIADRVAGRRQPAVAVIEWVDPPFTAGHWVPDLVTAAGGRPVTACPGGRSAQTSWDRIAAQRPEVVVVAPCGFHLDAAAAQAELAARQLPGIPVWAIDADGLVVRPGPRLVDGVEALAAILHPSLAAAVPAGRIRRVA
jgi:iron complex transport system substrate-binding protein